MNMACESWQAKLDTYLDGELSPEETHAFNAHVRGCTLCAAEALARVQAKRSVQAAGKRFAPSAEFRSRMQRHIAARPRWSAGFAWILATAAVVAFAVAGLSGSYLGRVRARTAQVYSELADLHVQTLASSSPVDVVSTDRHTVKPWFQGKIPFSFDLPELENTEFSLLGGRMTYLEQAPGAHLVYRVRKHEISVFIFQQESLQSKLDEDSTVRSRLSFNLETWSQGGLRYFVIGDAAPSDIESLSKLLRGTKA
jgi:anti-sigma factor RsiW